MSGIVKTYYHDGSIKSEVYENNGKKEGIYKEYNLIQKIKIECNYIDNKLNGVYKEYFNNGKLYKECNYIDDKLEGKCYVNNTYSKIEAFYKDGELNGFYRETKIQYSISDYGMLIPKIIESNYKNNKKNGIEIGYFGDGRKVYEYNYVDDELVDIIYKFSI